MSNHGTGFIESEALLSAMDGEVEDLIEVVRGMLPGEREALQRALSLLSNVLSTDAPPSSFPCPNCQARPGHSCTAPDDTGRHPIGRHHAARVDLAERANGA